MKFKLYLLPLLSFLILESSFAKWIDRMKDARYNIVFEKDKRVICDEFERKSGVSLRNTMKINLDMRYYEEVMPRHGAPWNTMTDTQKAAVCTVTSHRISKDMAFHSLSPKAQYFICLEFENKNNIPHHFNPKFKNFTSTRKWYDLNLTDRKKTCLGVYTKSEPLTRWERLEKEMYADFSKNKAKLLKKWERENAETKKNFRRKVNQFNHDFNQKVGRIKTKSSSIQKSMKNDIENLKVKSISHLGKFSNIGKKKDKRKELAHSIMYVFSNGLIGHKKKCTIESVFNENLSIKERFFNIFKVMNEEDEKKEKAFAERMSRSAKDQIKRIQSL